MCFNINTKEQQTPKVARHDITIYKTEGRAFLWFYWPSFRSFTYLINKKTKRVNIKIKNVLGDSSWYFGQIEMGYHGYNTYGLGCTWNNILTSEGYYARNCGQPTVAKFIIPTGTLYYENNTTIVAEQVIYKGTEKVSKDWIKRCQNEFRNSKNYLEHEPGDS